MVNFAVDTSKMTVPELREYNKAVQEALKFIQQNQIFYIQPHPKQQLFFHPDRPVYPRFRAFQGGNRTGKSEAGAMEAYAFSQGERPWDGTKTPLPAPNRGRIVGTSYLDGIKKVIEKKINNLWPQASIKDTKKGQQGAIAEIEMTNGTIVDLLSLEQDPLKHEGADIDWVWFDEPPSRAHWIANTRGLVDRGGHAWMTMTPLSEAWILDEIILKSTSDAKDAHLYYYVQASMYDNLGYGLKRQNIEEFEASLTEEEKAVRIYGEWLALQGLVFKEYRDHYYIGEPENQGGHLVKPFEIPPHWPRWCGIDPHERTPTQVTWFAVAENGDCYAYDEATFGGMDIGTIAEKIKEQETKQRSPSTRPILRIIDPASSRQNNIKEVGDSIKDTFLMHGIYCYKAINEIDAGHKKIREFLKFNELPLNKKVGPKLFIFDTCAALRHSFARYVWDEWKGPDKNERYGKPTPKDRDKHPMDTLRYVLMSNPRYFKAPSKSGKRQNSRRKPARSRKKGRR